jgi:hypothetical protein
MPIAERAFNVANNFQRSLKYHFIPIYEVYLTKKKGEATTFIMNSLRMNNSDDTINLSSFWR